MKKLFSLILIVMLLLLSACGNSDINNDIITDPVENSDVSPERENKETTPKHQYVGDYEQEPVYQKIKEIETCKNPDILCQLLAEVYGEEISYIKMEYAGQSESAPNDSKWYGYEEPYKNFMCGVTSIYNSDLYKGILTSDTYVFFKPYNETPSFVMDCDGSYIVSSYEIKQLDDGTSGNYVSGWVVSDLFLCLHEYIDEDAEEKAFMRDAVRYMDWYLEFENLIVDSLNGNIGSITQTESLRPSINILSVEITGPTMHELNVKYQIKNISEERGVVYLTCSGHDYQDELHFNDENFKNDYREDGSFDYGVYYDGNEKPTTFTIFYGYGEFDPYEGWDNECMTTITLLYTEDYGEISSSTIPSDEIYPLYFEGKYVGAWTYHESRDLIEIGGNSTSVP